MSSEPRTFTSSQLGVRNLIETLASIPDGVKMTIKRTGQTHIDGNGTEQERVFLIAIVEKVTETNSQWLRDRGFKNVDADLPDHLKR